MTIFVTRARVVTSIRRALDEWGFVEVETPVLQPRYGGAFARPFTTHHNELDADLYLRIATELYLKRLIVGGLERVYEIGKDFRNEGVSFKHNPEFTMLEWYEAYADYRDTMERIEQLVERVAREVLGTTAVTFRGHELDLAARGSACGSSRRSRATSSGRATRTSSGRGSTERGVDTDADRDWTQLVDHAFSHYVEPGLIQPTIVHDYPVELSPFARPTDDDPRLTERFEYFAGGMELGNAFTEINEAAMQQARVRPAVRAGRGRARRPGLRRGALLRHASDGRARVRDRPLRDAPHGKGVDPGRRALPRAAAVSGARAAAVLRAEADGAPKRGTPHEGSSAHDGRDDTRMVAAHRADDRRPSLVDRRRQNGGFAEAHASAVLRAALDGVVTIDHRGRVMEFNRAAERLFGYAREDALGRELAELIVPAASREAHRRGLARWVDGPPVDGGGALVGRRVEVIARNAEGDEFPVEVAVTRLELPGPPIFTASIRDISDRRRSEERLRAAEEQFRTLVEQLPLVVYIDAIDDASSNIYSSPQVEAMLGYSPSRVDAGSRALRTDAAPRRPGARARRAPSRAPRRRAVAGVSRDRPRRPRRLDPRRGPDDSGAVRGAAGAAGLLPRHHGKARGGGAPSLPGLPRPSDGPAEPGPLQAESRGGDREDGRRRLGCRRADPRHRRLQGGERPIRSRRCRRGAAGRRIEAPRGASPDRDGRAHRRGRVRGTRRIDRPGRGGRQDRARRRRGAARTDADRRRRDLRHREHRHRRRRRRRRPLPAGRPGDVPRQGERQGAVRPLRPVDWTTPSGTGSRC